MENLGFFAAAVVAANTAGVETGWLNLLSWSYVGSRVVYNLIYANNTTEVLATARSATYFTGVGLCLGLYVSAGNKVSGGLF